MLRLSYISLIVAISVSCNIRVNKSEKENNSPKDTLSLKHYLDQNYFIKDSIYFNYDGDKKALIITMAHSNEYLLEFESIHDEPIKRIFLFYNKNHNNYTKIIDNSNILPSLGYGERSNIGYYNLQAKQDTFYFNTLLLPHTSNDEYDIQFIFVFDDNKIWSLNKVTINTHSKKYSIDASKFGKIPARDFNIYKFNPFLYTSHN